MSLQNRVLVISVFFFGSWGLLSFPGRAVVAASECSASASIEIKPRGAMTDGLQGKLVLRPVEGEGEEVTFEARVGDPVTVKLPCSSKWEATAVFPETWGPRVMVEAGASGTTFASQISLWPLGRLAGSVKLAGKGERFPKKLVVTTLAPRPPASKDVPKGALECPVDIQGKWQCPPLPATTFDLVLSAEGFIPQYRWEAKILPGKATDLGAVKLERGASVAGWVEVEEGGIDADCRARLTPMLAPGSGVQIAEKVRSTGNEVSVRKDGFFQFSGVAPGSYSLEVRQEGFAAATVQPVEVWPRSETFLRGPVTLKRPIRLELTLSPALDWLGRPWKVEVYRASEGSTTFNDKVYAGPGDDQGLVTTPGRAPGRFRVQVSDGLDNRLFSKLFDVAGPADARQTIELEILTISGRVRIGREPVAATLWFGGRYGSPGVEMESDQDGKFHGVLPRDGWWRVDIASAGPKFETRAKVKVEADRQGRATAEIDLPATRLFGKVVDDAGRPAPSAILALATDEGDVIAKTDLQGSFDVRGLAEGMAYAVATFSSSQGEWTSDRISFFIRDGEDTGPIEVRMRKSKRLTGRVQSALGPVPGAGISVMSVHPVMLGGDSVRTELDGTFTAHVPAITETAAVIVSPPGHALKAFLVPIGEEPQPLTVPQEGGDLEILFPERPKDVGKEEVSLWIFQNGITLPMYSLQNWILGYGKQLPVNPKKLTVPALAPGDYRACLVAQAMIVPWEASGWTAPLARCATGQLTAGGTLRLDLSAD